MQYGGVARRPRSGHHGGVNGLPRDSGVTSYLDPVRPPAISGHVRPVQRKRGVMWYVKYRAPDATALGGVRQVNKLLGPEWPDGGPPPPGYFDRRTAQAALEAILTDARRGHMEVVRTGVSFERLAQEWLAWGEHERGWRRATLVDRRSCLRLHLLPAFGRLRVEQVTTARIERWSRTSSCGPASAGRRRSWWRCCTRCTSAPGCSMESSATRSRTLSAFASGTTRLGSTSTRPRRSGRSSARPRTSRMGRSS